MEALAPPGMMPVAYLVVYKYHCHIMEADFCGTQWRAFVAERLLTVKVTVVAEFAAERQDRRRLSTANWPEDTCCFACRCRSTWSTGDGGGGLKWGVGGGSGGTVKGDFVEDTAEVGDRPLL